MQQRTFMAPNFGRRGGARENYGEKLALSSPPSLLPLLSSSPNDDWQAVRARQLLARGLHEYSPTGFCPCAPPGSHENRNLCI